MRFFFILFSFILPLSAFANTFRQEHFDPVVEKLTDTTSLEFFLAGGLSAALIRPHDDEIRSDWKNHQKMSAENSHAGDLLGSGLPGVLITAGQYFWDSDSSHYESHARTLVYSTLLNSTLKFAFQRERPNEKDHFSFPSGHSMTAFATASSLTYAYGYGAAAITYPLAAFVAVSRLSDDAHWGSDVVAGAFVGIIMGRACFYNLNKDSKKAQAQIYPYFQTGESGVRLVYTY